MASIMRASTEALAQSGAIKKVSNQDGTTSNKYEYSRGYEQSLSVSSTTSGNDTAIKRPSVSGDVYGAVYAYFEGKSKSAPVAKTMAYLLLDACKINNVDPLLVIDGAKQNNAILINEFQPFINALRAAGDKHEITSRTVNSRSSKSGLISP